MLSLKQFLIEKEIHAKATGDSAEHEAAVILRQVLPSHLHLSYGRGKTKEGGDAPDLIIHGPGHVHEGKIAHTTKVAHAILTKKKNGRWAFTVVAHKDVHHNVAKHAPEITHGLKAMLRKRPQGTEKNPKSTRFGKASVAHAINFKPVTSDSVPHVQFHAEGSLTENGHALVHAIEQHVKEHGPFVIDVKSGGGSQLSNMKFHAKRNPESGEMHINFEGGSFPKETHERFSRFVLHHAGHHIHKYLNDLSAVVGHVIHSTRVTKHRLKINGQDTAPSSGPLDIPEAKLKTVKFSHIIGTEQDAAAGARLAFDRPASEYQLEEHK